MAAKMLASAFSYGSGMSGGLRSPSMFVGAMLGSAIWHLLVLVQPGSTIARGAFALVWMGALFVATIQVPFTSILLISVMTHIYVIFLPLLFAIAYSNVAV